MAAPAPAAAPKPPVEVKEDPPEEEEEEGEGATAEDTAREATAGLHPGLLPAPPGSTIEALDALMEDLGGSTTSTGVVRCRFEGCGEEGQAAELKLHYAG